jgi:hypothetical protein
VYGVVVIDSITHLWEAAKAAYNGKMMANGGIPIQAWGNIKKPYKRMMTRFLDGKFHAIVCGREGLVGSLEDAQKKDIAAKDAQEESTVKAQQSLFDAIRKAIRDASTPEALATAWELTKGKKTKLGQLFSGLVEEMTNRRTEILSKKEVA